MSCVHVAALQLAPIPYAFPAQTRQFNKALTSSGTFTVPYFRRRIPMVSLKSTSLTRRNQPLSTMCSLSSASLTSDCRKPEPMRLFGKCVSENGNKASPLKATEKSVGGFEKGMTTEDLLKKQILNKDHGGNGGSTGRKPPSGGGGPGDESMWDGEEFKQVTFATLAIIFVCIYIVERAQINALAKDSLQYLFTRKQSARLKRITESFMKFLQSMRGDEYRDQNQEHEIITTPGDNDSDDSYDSDDDEDDD